MLLPRTSSVGWSCSIDSDVLAGHIRRYMTLAIASWRIWLLYLVACVSLVLDRAGFEPLLRLRLIETERPFHGPYFEWHKSRSAFGMPRLTTERRTP